MKRNHLEKDGGNNIIRYILQIRVELHFLFRLRTLCISCSKRVGMVKEKPGVATLKPQKNSPEM